MTLSLLQAAVRQRATAPLALDLLSQLERLMAIPKPHLPDTGAQLSRRELVVLQLLVGGASNRLIAERLDITLPTVKSHVTNLLQKLNVTRRQDAVLRAQELGLS